MLDISAQDFNPNPRIKKPTKQYLAEIEKERKENLMARMVMLKSVVNSPKLLHLSFNIKDAELY